MKVTLLLRNDHDAIKSLFSKYKKAGARNQNGKKELFEAVRRELMIHSQMETEIFYPALTGTSSKTATQLVSTAVEEHDSMEKLLDQIGAMSPTDAGRVRRGAPVPGWRRTGPGDRRPQENIGPTCGVKKRAERISHKKHKKF